MAAINTTSRKFSPVPFTNVKVDDVFWSPRINANREHTIPHEYRQCEETGRIEAFNMNWKPGMEPKPHIFWDSDVAKWIEAASYSLATYPDTELDSLIDDVIALVASAQQPDGYLNTYFTQVEPQKRWTDLRDCHELYCAGHMIEAGVAHFQATGKRTLLDAMCRYADHIDSTFGTEPGKKQGYCGHEEIELALVKLYHVTGNERYLKLSEYFVNQRGQKPNYFDVEKATRGGAPGYFGDFMERNDNGTLNYSYNQAHIPVREQTEVTGHAVRAMYLYSAMADLAGELGDDSLKAACERLWEDLCLKKMYITGGIGPSRHNEGFTAPYDLPNETAYAETCAAIGLVFWNHRMLQIDCDSRYADVIERALYNGAISGVSLDGKKFFYENPLASNGNHHRQDWFGCSCCPPNIARIMASIGEYIYSTSANGLAVHLYVQGEAITTLADGTKVNIKQTTQYPWDGTVQLEVNPASESDFALRLRIPGWCRNYAISVNGEAVTPQVEKGYAIISRKWQSGDMVDFNMKMPVERVKAHPSVAADRGRAAIQRGPVVYCLENADHPVSVSKVTLPKDAVLTPKWEPELMNGIMTIEGEVLAPDDSVWQDKLYQPKNQAGTKKIPLRAIPYCVWDNRAEGEMAVWLPES